MPSRADDGEGVPDVVPTMGPCRQHGTDEQLADLSAHETSRTRYS
jgi:hypothetical protein